MRPHPEASQAVFNWLKDSGVKSSEIEKRGEWVHFRATRDKADSMMNTKFLVYRHLGKRDTDSIRTTKVHLPRSVSQYVKMIHPTTRFGLMKEQSSLIHDVEALSEEEIQETVTRMAIDEPSQTGCNSTITPKCLMNLYKIGGVTVYPEKAGRVGVAGFLQQYARFSDLAKFTQQTAQWAGNANFTWQGVNGKDIRR
jgi:tripeptidyl-peptidase I